MMLWFLVAFYEAMKLISLRKMQNQGYGNKGSGIVENIL